MDPYDVEVGQPITFVMNEDLVVATHRVVEIDKENQRFYTKGDANENVDGAPVHFNNLIGVPVYSITISRLFGKLHPEPAGFVCGHRRRSRPAPDDVPSGAFQRG